MPMRYPKDFRRAICARLVAGEKVNALSKEVGASERESHPCNIGADGVRMDDRGARRRLRSGRRHVGVCRPRPRARPHE